MDRYFSKAHDATGASCVVSFKACRVGACNAAHGCSACSAGVTTPMMLGPETAEPDGADVPQGEGE